MHCTCNGDEREAKRREKENLPEETKSEQFERLQEENDTRTDSERVEFGDFYSI